MPITVLTNSILKTRLQIANCCAAKKGYELIVLQNKGISCRKDQRKVQQMLDIIDAIKEYINMTDTVQASCEYDASGWTGGSASFNLTCTTDFLIGGTNSRTVVGQSSVDGAFAALVAVYNGLGLGTIAFYNSSTNEFTLIDPTDIGAAGNVRNLIFSANGGGAPVINSPAGAFSGGITGNGDNEVDDTNACLTNEQLIVMLDKLCELCNEPCSTVVNFES